MMLDDLLLVKEMTEGMGQLCVLYILSFSYLFLSRKQTTKLVASQSKSLTKAKGKAI